MTPEFTTIEMSKEQAEFLAQCQKYYKQIKFHIAEGLWEKKGGSYTVNFKQSGEIENAVEHRFHYPV